MIWRVAAVLTVVFWTAMSGLLLRDIYFPEASRFAQVPPRVVIDLFLRQSDVFGSVLHLYHRDEKIGHANFQVSRKITPANTVAYDVLARGVVEQDVQSPHAAVPLKQVLATWNVAFTVAESGQWKHLALSVQFPGKETSLDLSWNNGAEMPQVLMRQSGKVVMNSQELQMLMKLGAGKQGAQSLLTMMGGGVLPKDALEPRELHLQAREGVITLARRERKCYVLTLPLISDQAVTMIFTDGGELARIEMPDEYVLLEPAIHGLQN